MIIYTIFVVALGAIAGIIINYLADVLPYTRRFSAPVCRVCEHKFTIREYLISFRCPECKSKPRLRYYLVIIGMMLMSVLAALLPIKGLSYWAVLPLFTFLGLIVTIDIEHRVVLNETSIFGAVFMLILGIIMKGVWITLLGGVVGFGSMLLLYYGGILFTKILSKARHQQIDEVALGFGDVNVTGFLGFLIGWPDILSTLAIAILLGGVISLLVMIVLGLLRKYQAFSAIAYAPFLVIAAVFVLFIR